jgi:hypothetical protein
MDYHPGVTALYGLIRKEYAALSGDTFRLSLVIIEQAGDHCITLLKYGMAVLPVE